VVQECLAAEDLKFIIGERSFHRREIFHFGRNFYTSNSSLGNLPASQLPAFPLWTLMKRLALHHANDHPGGAGAVFLGIVIDPQTTGKLLGFLDLVGHYRHRRVGMGRIVSATDPRDLFFSMWQTAVTEQALKPDYSLSVTDVFIRAAIAYLNRKGGLQFLQLVDGIVMSTNAYSLPSWVPDWAHPAERESLDQNGLDVWSAEPCRPIPAGSYDPQVLGSEMHIRGAVIDRIIKILEHPLEAISMALRANQEDCFALNTVQRILDLDSRVHGVLDHRRIFKVLSQGYPVSRNPDNDADFTYIQFDEESRDPDEESYTSYIRYEEEFAANRASMETAPSAMVEGTLLREVLAVHGSQGLSDTRSSLLAIAEKLSGRRLAICASGALTVVPVRTRAGDCISLAYQAVTPLVLRGTGRSRYLFVGDAYREFIPTDRAVEVRVDEHARRIHTLALTGDDRMILI